MKPAITWNIRAEDGSKYEARLSLSIIDMEPTMDRTTHSMKFTKFEQK